jgi:hypothetical protein
LELDEHNRRRFRIQGRLLLRDCGKPDLPRGLPQLRAATTSGVVCCFSL